MAGFATYQALAQAASSGSGDTTAWSKDAQDSLGATLWCSTWLRSGTPAAGANPAGTPGTSYVGAAGALTFPDVFPQLRFLTQFGYGMAGQVASAMLYDRLVGVGSLSITSVGNRTVNSVALPRYTDGFGVQAWIEIPSALTVSSSLTFTLTSYTNQDGVAGRAGTAFGVPLTSLPAGAMFGPLPLQGGDLGVRSVQVGLGIGGTVPASGVVNLVLLKPLLFLPSFTGLTGGNSAPNERDQVLMCCRLPRLFDGASLSLALLAYNATVSTTGNAGTVSTVWG